MIAAKTSVRPADKAKKQDFDDLKKNYLAYSQEHSRSHNGASLTGQLKADADKCLATIKKEYERLKDHQGSFESKKPIQQPKKKRSLIF